MDATIPAAVRLTVSSNPKSRPYFRAVTVVVDQFALGQTFNPVALNEVISNTSIQATPEALAAIDSAVSLYKIFYDDVVALKLDQVKNLRPLLVALSTDIAKGISLPGFAHKAN